MFQIQNHNCPPKFGMSPLMTDQLRTRSMVEILFWTRKMCLIGHYGWEFTSSGSILIGSFRFFWLSWLNFLGSSSRVRLGLWIFSGKPESDLILLLISSSALDFDLFRSLAESGRPLVGYIRGSWTETLVRKYQRKIRTGVDHEMKVSSYKLE